MHLKLIRDREHSPEGCVFGRLYINGKPACWTLEDQEREWTDGVDGLTAEEKVYAETAIPTGVYRVIVSYSNRFKRDLPLLVDVPNFSGVRIHPGNFAGKETLVKRIPKDTLKDVLYSDECLEVTND